MYKYDTFKELFESFDYEILELNDDDTADIMNKFYTKEEQDKYGALGIEISLINENNG